LIVAGVMSGTSADGVDVAVISIQGRGSYLSFDLLLHDHSEYPPAIRKAVLAAMNASQISVAELSRLNFRLGEFYAEAVSKAQKKSGQKRHSSIGTPSPAAARMVLQTLSMSWSRPGRPSRAFL